MINNFKSKISLFIFVFILLALYSPSEVLAVGENCETFQDCDDNNMCIRLKALGSKKCYPKIGGGCNGDDDCAQIEPNLNIPGAFCDKSRATENYPGSCFSDQKAPETTTKDGCSWRIKRPVPGTYTYQGGCFSNETEKDPKDCSTIAQPRDYQPPEQSLHCCCLGTTPIQAAPKFDPPQLQIQIPGLVFEEADVDCVNLKDGSYSCSIHWIGKYISAIYNYSLTIGGILAALMLMAGGLLWLTSGGDSSKVTKAKSLIGGSITGLIILFSAYMILYEVNPELTKLKPININSISDTGSGSASSLSTIITDGWEWDSGIINQVGDASPELSSFINCMRKNLPNGVGRISSISDNNFIGKLTLCETNCSGCVHSCGSCHYGGGLKTNKSYAIDFGDEENKTELVKAANICGVFEEPNKPGFILDEGNHLHMSVPACPRN